jgi:hypothetical protein
MRVCAGLVLATWVMVACESPAEENLEAQQPSTFAVSGPDGTNHWIVVKCAAAHECYERASITCPAGWSVYDKDKSTSYQVAGRSVSNTTNWGAGDSTTVAKHEDTVLPIEHGEMLVKCGSSEQNDAKLLDQLKALCEDGNANACKAQDFATKKRGCCAWHQGARSCNENHKVVCFDGVESETCSC